jgi:N-acetylglutamate synthase-like GNAT family acetyltransferase
MIRPCSRGDADHIHRVINDGAEAYRGVIPADRWHVPYMSLSKLLREMDRGVHFHGFYQDGTLVGVMGIEDVKDVSLIRHAYVGTVHQRQGVGTSLTDNLISSTRRPLLVGTWAAATWAIRFYKGRGFTLVTPEEKDFLLDSYWSIPQRQRDTSVVLADERWRRMWAH